MGYGSKEVFASSGKWQKHSGETLASLEHQGMRQSYGGPRLQLTFQR